jgi:tRNA-dihydrouridine synthase
VVVNGDITTFEQAARALEVSGADAVMIGRGAQGQPWLPGQIARRLDGGEQEAVPHLDKQLDHVCNLYDQVVEHYGPRVGARHARKHLGWALDVAAKGSAASADALKRWRQVILTATDPAHVRRSLHDAFGEFSWSAAA